MKAIKKRHESEQQSKEVQVTFSRKHAHGKKDDVQEIPKYINVQKVNKIAVGICKGAANLTYLQKGVPAMTGCGNVYELKENKYAADVEDNVYLKRNYGINVSQVKSME